MTNTPMTEKEKEKILKMHTSGDPYHVIANRIGRSTKAVETVVRRFKTDECPAYKFINYLRKPWPYNGQ